ncbi:hypothetical protein TNIN_435601 [Trichonephila inaurata madagascariensis]|uniref:Uncharacterized protein n=1 Tax=Trichonephila inaurata madagascariensis TaxID=2747483 RepID=A0A8X6XY83_9ARAC|nr:hypothetical protein TNIN_435601 [Trichonephila inaurata madagascariensis]
MWNKCGQECTERIEGKPFHPDGHHRQQDHSMLDMPACPSSPVFSQEGRSKGKEECIVQRRKQETGKLKGTQVKRERGKSKRGNSKYQMGKRGDPNRPSVQGQLANVQGQQANVQWEIQTRKLQISNGEEK